MKKNKFKLYLHSFPNNKFYVGITSQDKHARWKGGHGYMNQPLVWNAIQKYGWNNIKHEIILESNDENLIKNEEYRLITEVYKSNQREFGYNIENGGTRNCMTNEIKEKISKANKNRKWGTLEERYGNEKAAKLREARRIRSLGTGNPAFGKRWWTNGILNKFSKECPEGFRLGWEGDTSKFMTNKGKPRSEEVRLKISKANYGKPNLHAKGKPFTEEHKRKLSERSKGRVKRLDERINISIANHCKQINIKFFSKKEWHKIVNHEWHTLWVGNDK